MNRIINRVGNETKIFTQSFDQGVYDQVESLANYGPYLREKIRIMPDAHVGKGATIGTTMTITDMVTPNLVGVDIGCGVLTSKLKEKEVNLSKLDDIIKKKIPSGYSVRRKAIGDFDFSDLRSADYANLERAYLSIGTLGGGNHFIELNRGEDDSLYLVIHSGSRHLGTNVWKYYQDLANEYAAEDRREHKNQMKELKKSLSKEEYKKELKNSQPYSTNRDLAHLFGSDFDDYLNDMKIVQKFATINRKTMADVILSEMGLTAVDQFETIHNYIDIDNMILRKGAVSAQDGEILLVPINMRDGSLICRGKGNEDWNYSAPHGAGRLMSRSKAKKEIAMEDFRASMKGIYTSSVNSSTIDEAPQAYKPMSEIINSIGDTAEVLEIITPIYNFKAK